VIRKQSPRPCRYILIFARNPPGDAGGRAGTA
jgi:hypothetical protein